MRALFTLAFVVLLGAVAGGPVQLEPLPPITHPIAVDRAAWRHDVAAVGPYETAFFTPGTAVFVSYHSILALDMHGRRRWSTNENTYVVHVGERAIVYNGDAGLLTSRDIRSGTLLWKQSACPADVAQQKNGGRVSTITAHGAEFVVGCLGGRVARVDQ